MAEKTESDQNKTPCEEQLACEHDYDADGYCLKCYAKEFCEFCDEDIWDSFFYCTHCGIGICDECIGICTKCGDEEICTRCVEEVNCE